MKQHWMRWGTLLLCAVLFFWGVGRSPLPTILAALVLLLLIMVYALMNIR